MNIYCDDNGFNLQAGFLYDKDGKKKYVVLSIEEWEEILEHLEDLEDIRALDKAKEDKEDKLVPFDKVKKEIDQAV